MKKFAALVLFAPLLAVAPLPAAPPAANPGIVYQLEVREVGAAGEPMTMTTSIEGENLKIEVPPQNGQGRTDMIFRGDRREMIMVNHGARRYVVMDEATIKQMTAQLSSAMSQMQEMLKNVPPEQRAAMEEMMRGRGMAMPSQQAPSELRRTSESGTQSGYAAVKYQIVRDGTVERDLWVTEWANIEGSAEARPAFERMASFMQELMAGLTEIVGDMGQDSFRHMSEMNGFPVLTVEYDDDGQPEMETRLLSASEQTLPATAFEPPSGYTRQSIGG